MEKLEVLENLHYLPIIIFIALPTTVIATYVIAVVLSHVEAGFPYISDAATYAPESCIFAQFINMTAALMSFFIYIRYSQIKECTIAFRLNELLQKWNRAGLILGLMSTLGLSIVANFQETSVIVVHFIGAFMCFGCGTLYFWSQAICSYYLHPLGCSLRVAHARLAMSVFNTIFFIVILVCGILAHRAYRGKNPRKWYKEDGGWELHVVSTAAEWFCATLFCLYILSFTDEFKDIKLLHPKREIRDENLPIINKPHVYEKRKRKKFANNRGQSAENAIVPSKIISLSLSLLLAALLQAVRCLADLVEDAFRSVSFEKNSLLE